MGPCATPTGRSLGLGLAPPASPTSARRPAQRATLLDVSAEQKPHHIARRQRSGLGPALAQFPMASRPLAAFLCVRAASTERPSSFRTPWLPRVIALNSAAAGVHNPCRGSPPVPCRPACYFLHHRTARPRWPPAAQVLATSHDFSSPAYGNRSPPDLNCMFFAICSGLSRSSSAQLWESTRNRSESPYVSRLCTWRHPRLPGR
jgi:hypothetical protein